MAKLSVSKYDSFRTCPRLYYFSHVLYIERVRQEGARRYGDLFHKALEAWWPAMGWGENPPPWIDKALALRSMLKAIEDSARNIETDPYEVARAEAMAVAYHARWYDAEFSLIPGSVEGWFEVPLLDPDGRVVPRWFVNGKKDALARFSGIPRVVEHKTTTQEIHAGSTYFEKLATNLQVSAYIDTASQYLGEPVDGAHYDIARKPDIAPFRATPEAEREYTKGKGCKTCGGTLSGEIKPGSGHVMKERTKKGKLIAAHADEVASAPDLAEPCPDCVATPGMSELPRLYAKCHDKDEPIEDYKTRITNELTRAPDLYFWQGVVRRSEHELMEARADLVSMASEVDHAFARMRKMPDAQQRQAWPRNHNACQYQYGRRCDFYEVCTTSVDPLQTPLYKIKEHPNKRAQVQS